jgi:putative ABC transport system permease protein
MHEARRILRRTARRPAYFAGTAGTVLVAAGLGAVAFALFDAVFIRPLPYVESARVVQIGMLDRSDRADLAGVSGFDIHAWREQSDAFEALAVWTWIGRGSSLSEKDSLRGLRLAHVSTEFFKVLGATPLLGTPLELVDPRSRRWEVFLSHALWRSEFGASDDVIGRRLEFPSLGGEWFVQGVMPPEFDYPAGADLWLAGDFEPRRPMAYTPAQRAEGRLTAIARLRSNRTASDLESELRLISARIAPTEADLGRYYTPSVVPLQRAVLGRYDAVWSSFAIAVLCVLIIGAISILNLTVSRLSEESPSLLVRTLLGATGSRLLIGPLLELVLPCFVGVLGGWLLAHWLVHVLRLNLAAEVPRVAEIAVSPGGLAASTAAFLIPVVVVALACMLRTIHRLRRSEPSASGVETSRVRGRRWLLVTQVAPTTALLFMTILMLQTAWNLAGIDTGLHSERLFFARLGVIPGAAPAGDASREAVSGGMALRLGLGEVLARVRALPHVRAAEAISHAPFSADEGFVAYFNRANDLVPYESPDRSWSAVESVVTPGFFASLGIPLLAGNDFTDSPIRTSAASDKIRSRSVVVTASLARRLWGHEDVIGRRIGQDEVIGVVADVRYAAFGEDPRPRMYYSHLQSHRNDFTLLISTDRGHELATLSALRNEVGIVLGPRYRVYGVDTLEGLLRRYAQDRLLTTLLLTTCAVIGIGLALIGVGTLTASIVRGTQHEMGIRAALGADRRTLIRWLTARTGLWVIVGVAAGLSGGVLLSRIMDSLLFGVQPWSAKAMLPAAALALLAGALAIQTPIRRLTGSDPAVVLRNL